MTSDVAAHPETVQTLVDMLVCALRDHGLHAEQCGAAMVWVANRAADPPGNDPRDMRRSPGLRQSVLCRKDESGHLGWYWVWTWPTCAELEYERFACAVEIDEAAARVASVLALRTECAP